MRGVSNKHCLLTFFIISVPEGCSILANSADPDEMQHDAAFHLGLHCLPKYPFRVSSIIKGYNPINLIVLRVENTDQDRCL